LSSTQFEIGNTITVYGTGFSTKEGELKVLFNPKSTAGLVSDASIPADASSTNGTSCTCVVPPGCGTGAISVTSDGDNSPECDTEYISLPTITSVTPIYVYPNSDGIDSLIQIVGTNFNSSKKNTIEFGNEARVDTHAYNSTNLTNVKVPVGATGAIRVDSFGEYGEKSLQKIYALTEFWKEVFGGLKKVSGSTDLYNSKNTLHNGITMNVINNNLQPQNSIKLKGKQYGITVGKWITIYDKFAGAYMLSFKVPTGKKFFCIEQLETINDGTIARNIFIDYIYADSSKDLTSDTFTTSPNRRKTIHEIPTKGAGLKELRISFEETTDFKIYLSALKFMI